MRDQFHLFVYGTLRAGGTAVGMMAGCDHLGAAQVGGVLYDIDGSFPALVLYGGAPVQGEIWRCPASLLSQLDEYERVGEGLFRRVGVKVRSAAGDEIACWTYVAGPALARKLLPQNRL